MVYRVEITAFRCYGVRTYITLIVSAMVSSYIRAMVSSYTRLHKYMHVAI